MTQERGSIAPNGDQDILYVFCMCLYILCSHYTSMPKGTCAEIIAEVRDLQPTARKVHKPLSRASSSKSHF